MRLREDKYKKCIFSCRTTKRGWGVKPPDFYDLQKKLPEPHETQERKKNACHVQCSAISINHIEGNLYKIYLVDHYSSIIFLLIFFFFFWGGG